MSSKHESSHGFCVTFMGVVMHWVVLTPPGGSMGKPGFMEYEGGKSKRFGIRRKFM